jgi:uncharacterized protein with GYD domain
MPAMAPRRMAPGRLAMASYLVLANWTEQGIKNVKESPRRLDAARELGRKLGVEIKEFYMTMGAYDMVVRLEAGSDEAVAKLALALGAGGSLRTVTLKAFTEAEYREIVGSLP